MHSQKQNKQETKQKNTQWNNSKKKQKKTHKASKYIHEHAQYTQAQVITQFNH